MKKMLLALLVLALAAVSASAGVRIDWQVSYGAYDHTSSDITGGDNALLDSYAVTWQLIYAGINNQIDDPDLSNGANGWVGGDDAVWATRTIAQGGGLASDGTNYDNWMIWDALTGDTVYRDYSWNTAGWVYQRVYEGTPQALSWFYDGGLIEFGIGFNDTNEHLTPDYSQIGGLNEGFQPDQQFPIPEPATMSLLGLGALVMAIRRRRS
jgi:hypothetical protein